MVKLSYRRHRFPPVVIQHAVWLYLRFTLSYRDVEDLLAERGLDISYKTVRSWVLKFGPVIARRLQRRRPGLSDRWHLDGEFRRRRAAAPRFFEPAPRHSMTAKLPLSLRGARRRSNLASQEIPAGRDCFGSLTMTE